MNSRSKDIKTLTFETNPESLHPESNWDNTGSTVKTDRTG